MAPQVEPVHLISVNTAPERAKLILGKVIKEVEGRYNIVHVGNSETIEGVEALLLASKPTPQLLFCASMWTPEQQEEIQVIAKRTLPGIKTAALPPGLQVKIGPDGMVKYIVELIDTLGIPTRG